MTLCEWCEDPVDTHTAVGLVECLARLKGSEPVLEGEAGAAKAREARQALRDARRNT